MQKLRFFVSYSSRERQAAEALHACLEGNGCEVWRDQTRLRAGKDWSRDIALGLAESDVICLLWSQHSAESDWVKHEWLSARALEKLIVPCIFPKAPPLPLPLFNTHGIRLEENTLDAVE